MKSLFRKIMVSSLLLFSVYVLNTTLICADSYYDVGNFQYRVASGVAYLHGFDDSQSSITLPTSVTINGTKYKVREIDDKAFMNCYNLKSVKIPSGYLKIGNIAFKNCTNLENVYIDAELADCSHISTYMNPENSAFNSTDDYSVFYNTGTNTDGMTVTFGPNAHSIPDYLFATGFVESENKFAHVGKVIISEGVVSVGKCAFYRCYSLKEVVFPVSITHIYERAFESTGIKKLALPEKLPVIDEWAFYLCRDLESLTLPSSLSIIERYCFRFCEKLKTIKINSDLQDMGYLDFESVGQETEGTSVVFTNGVKRVPAYLFATEYDKEDLQFANVTDVSLPASVTEIREKAFYRCFNLKKITIPNKNVTFGNDVFTNDDNVIVYCPKGGTTWKYCTENGIHVEPISDPTPAKKPGKTAINKIGNVKKGIYIKWTKATNADKYVVERDNGSGWKQIATTTSCAYTDKAANVNGKQYRYRVIPYAGKTKGTTSSARGYYCLSYPKKITAKNTGKKKITVAWAKNEKGSGYEILYKTDDESKSVIINKNTTEKKVIKNLVVGKTYTIYVRAFKTVSGKKYYSAYGKVKTCKVEK